MIGLFNRKTRERFETTYTSDYGSLENDAAQSVVLAAIFKNEAPYLAEWVEYHLMTGFDRIVLYDNASNDDYRPAIAHHVAADRVTIVPWANFIDNISIQPLAYRHALMNFGRQARWMAFIDLDEFIVPLLTGDVKGTLAALEPHSAIYMPMVDFDHDGNETRPEGLVIENYRRSRYMGARDRVKPMLRPGKVKRMRIHRAETHGSVLDLTSEADTGKWPLRVNHYFSKSLEEFEAKKSRGWPAGAFKDDVRKDALLVEISEKGQQDSTILVHLDELKRRLKSGRPAHARR